MASIPGMIGMLPGLYGWPGMGMTPGVYDAEQLMLKHKKNGTINNDNIRQIIDECIAYNPDAADEILNKVAEIVPEFTDVINKYMMLT